MTTFQRQFTVASATAMAAAVTALLAGCGGGADNSAPTAKASAVATSTDTPTLSANQASFEEFLLRPSEGSYLLHWNLNVSGAQYKGINFAFADIGTLPASPLTNGPQFAPQGAAVNMTKTLGVTIPGPTRVLKDGVILVLPFTLTNQVSYVGDNVRVDALASDNTTVAYSAIRSNYETVALTGTLAATPADFAHFHDSMFSNPAVLEATATYAAGAKYIKFTKTNLGDRYNAGDCGATTTTADISPCRTNATLTTVLAAGQRSNSDGTTYYLADGTIRTMGGVQIWVANKPRPKSANYSYTEEFRTYFELNGNVYTGSLIKDGTVLGGSYYLSNINGTTVATRYTFLPFDIRMNKAAYDSLVAAMKI
ncbi:hypothetical protein OU995_04250 [Roseateles sp. SL47]|uniref:hypothetical protein n=1 Tax=Roseateles sp. SL47 TaxID=2995138 RepID=UPI00226EBE08|nr:hypothetical protein [Roseateles sp. SL47]WAC73954.1 hypothetical protein OU995_04250 [Roseateles sp. SL47]